nr:venom protein [Lampona murina]
MKTSVTTVIIFVTLVLISVTNFSCGKELPKKQKFEEQRSCVELMGRCENSDDPSCCGEMGCLCWHLGNSKQEECQCRYIIKMVAQPLCCGY